MVVCNIKSINCLLICLNSLKVASVKHANSSSIGYDEENNIVFINIFKKEIIDSLPEGYLEPNDKLVNIINNECGSNISCSPTNIVVGKVVECNPIPGTHLSHCLVNVGQEKNKVIVCGAKNVRVDLLVVVALPWTIIPNGLEIKVNKIREIVSEGMLCSKRELNILDERFNDQGIIELNEQYQVGQTFVVGKQVC